MTYNEGIFSLSILTRPTIQLLLKVGGGVGVLVYKLCHKITCLWGPRPGLTQTGLTFRFLESRGIVIVLSMW